MEEFHFIGKVRQSGLIVAADTGRVLLTRDTRSDSWELPGGRLHRGEVPVEGFRREIREELGIDVVPRKILRTDLMRHGHSESEIFFVVYEATVPSEAMQFSFDPIEVAEATWVGSDGYSDIKLFPDALIALDTYFSNFDADSKISQ